MTAPSETPHKIRLPQQIAATRAAIALYERLTPSWRRHKVMSTEEARETMDGLRASLRTLEWLQGMNARGRFPHRNMS